jgi:hypothetical protein
VPLDHEAQGQTHTDKVEPLTRRVAEVAHDEVYVTLGTAKFGVQLAGPDLRVWRELVLDAADVEEERLKFLELGGRQLEKAGGSRRSSKAKMGGSKSELRIREGDVLVKGCSGGLLVLLERVCRRLESAPELTLGSIREAEPVAMRTSVVPVSTIPAVESKIAPPVPYLIV